MDGENNGKAYQMDDLGVPLFLETPISSHRIHWTAFFYLHEQLSLYGKLAVVGKKNPHIDPIHEV